ncbi:MAG: MarR family transcriptional regulator [Saezia sp.]
MHARTTAPRSNKKFDVLDLLRNNEALSIAEIANQLNISSKNVSSLLTYLRKDEYIIHRDHTGRVYLLDRAQQIEPASNDEPQA